MRMPARNRPKKGKRIAPPRFEQTIIVDGYNLILRSPAFRPDDRRDLAQAREKLVNLLSWAIGRGESEFIVIFDGAEVGFGSRRTEKTGSVTVRFSKPPQKADDLIRSMVEDFSERDEKVTVVTADVEVANHARSCGSSVVLSDLFAASLFPDQVREQVKKYRGSGQGKPEEGSEKPTP